MPKMKTHRGAAKRLRVTGRGKVMRGHAFHSHFTGKKSPKRNRFLRKDVVLNETNEKAAKRLLGL
ncbi:MAG: 50S ribosomal protein L35 [Candidatus Aquicultorales bacterium]